MPGLLRCAFGSMFLCVLAFVPSVGKLNPALTERCPLPTPGLGRINLGDNALSAVPAVLCMLSSTHPKLRQIDLGGNRLEAIPTAVGRIGTTLTSLRLCRNPLTSLPASLGRLAGLTELLLHRCRLGAVPPGSVAWLGSKCALPWPTPSASRPPARNVEVP